MAGGQRQAFLRYQRHVAASAVIAMCFLAYAIDLGKYYNAGRSQTQEYNNECVSAPKMASGGAVTWRKEAVGTRAWRGHQNGAMRVCAREQRRPGMAYSVVEIGVSSSARIGSM
jgi:hypothetical protein